MTTPQQFDPSSLDPVVAAWLASGPTTLPDVTRRAIAEAVRVAPRQAHARLVSRPRGVTITGFQVLGIAAALAAFALVGTLAIASSRTPGPAGSIVPLPSATPSASPSPTVTPSPSPGVTPTLQTPSTGEGGVFTSTLYGYSVTLPAGWLAVPATRAWVPGELPSRSDLSDHFTRIDVSTQGTVVMIASSAIPDGLPEAAWLDQHLPPRRRAYAGICAGHGIGGLSPESWRSVDVAGHAARVRAACGYVDGVLTAGGRAYIITVKGQFKYDGATDRTHVLFDAFSTTLELRPEAAVEPGAGQPSP